MFSLCIRNMSGNIRVFALSSRFWAGDATKHFQKRMWFFNEEGGRHSVNEGFGEDFYRKGNSVKRSGPFNEPQDSETEKLLSPSTARNQLLTGAPWQENIMNPGLNKGHKSDGAQIGRRKNRETKHMHKGIWQTVCLRSVPGTFGGESLGRPGGPNP